MAKGDTLNNVNASWRQPASVYGPASSEYDEYAERVFSYGGGTAPFDIRTALGDYSCPIYYMSDATTGHTVRWYQASWAIQEGRPFSPIGSFTLGNETLPWNDDWEAAPSTDAAMIIIDDRIGSTYGNVYEIWMVVSNKNGFNESNITANPSYGFQLGPNFSCLVPWTDNDPTKRVCASISRYETESVYDLDDSSEGLSGFRGAGLQLSVGLLQADEVLRAMNGTPIDHALSMAVVNSIFGPASPLAFAASDAHGLNSFVGNGSDYAFYEYPATRFQHPNISTTFMPTTGSWSGLSINEKRARCVPAGMRYAHNLTDQEIEDWATSKSYSGFKRDAAVAVAKCLRDYGWIITDTTGYGVRIQTTGIANPEELAKWEQTGLVVSGVEDENFLSGLITSSSQIVVIAPPDRSGASIGAVPPILDSISSSTGPVTGGTSVVITGTFLANATSVFFGLIEVTPTSVTDTSLTVISPAHTAGSVDITIVTPLGTSDVIPEGVFTYTEVGSNPIISLVDPSAGSTSGGTAVTISGSNLTGVSSLKFGGVEATAVTGVSDTEITAVTPARPVGVVDVIATTPSGSSAVNSNAKFSYVAPVPTLSAIAPGTSPTVGGARVTISGTDLLNTISVLFGSTPGTNITVVNSSTVTVTTPPGSGTVDVTLTTSSGTSSVNPSVVLAYQNTNPPAITELYPNYGPITGGTVVTVTGTNLSNMASVSFGGTPGTIISSSATEAFIVSPQRPVGQILVTVITPTGSSSNNESAKFTYKDQPVTVVPTISAVSPSTLSTSGGLVTITGTNLTDVSSISFGGVQGSSISIMSDTSLTVVAPAHAAGVVNVVASSAGVSSAISSASRVTYQLTQRPEAIFTVLPRQTGVIPLAVAFDASESTGTGLTYSWEIDYDGTVEVSSSVNWEFVFEIPGTYTISLTVTDGTDTSTATKQVTALAEMGNTRRPWVFHDPVTAETYYMEVNPNTDNGSASISKSTKYESRASTYMNESDQLALNRTVAAYDSTGFDVFSYSGVIYSKDQFDTLTEWCNKDHPWQLRDDLGREFLIYVEIFETERVRSNKFQWKHKYTFSGIVIDEI